MPFRERDVPFSESLSVTAAPLQGKYGGNSELFEEDTSVDWTESCDLVLSIEWLNAIVAWASALEDGCEETTRIFFWLGVVMGCVKGCAGHYTNNILRVSAELAVVPTSSKNALGLSGCSAFSSSLLGSRGSRSSLTQCRI